MKPHFTLHPKPALLLTVIFLLLILYPYPSPKSASAVGGDITVGANLNVSSPFGLKSTRFYDIANPDFYLEPAGSSSLYNFTSSGSAYFNNFSSTGSAIFTGTFTIASPFTLGGTSVTTTGTKLNYLTSATGTTGTTSTNLVFSTSPSFSTDIRTPLIIGSTSADGTLTLEGNNTTGNTAGNANLIFKTGDSAGTTAMTILNNGNVGIGTTAPASLLHLVGGSGVTSGITLQNVITNATNKDGRIKVGHYTNAEEPVTEILGSSQSGVNYLSIGGGSSVENAMTELRFYTASNGTTLTGTQQMTINSSGLVGIGTAEPSEMLHIYKSANGTTAMVIENATSGTSAAAGIRLHNDTSWSWIYRTSTGYSAITPNSTVIQEGYGDIIFKGTGETMRIKNTGNVGIGTTAPGGALDVASAATTNGYWLDEKAAMTGETADNWLRLNQSSSWTNGTYTPSVLRVDGELRQGSADAGAYELQTSGDLYVALTSTLMGNVGIGTTSPYTTLEVRSPGASTDILTVTYGASAPLFRVGEGSGSNGYLALYHGATQNILLNGSSTTDSYINTNGLGLGMTSASVMLDVTGSIEYTGTITDVSDERLKENFASINNPLEKILATTAYQFNMIGQDPSKVELGYKAQDIQKILPELVSITDPENGYLGVNYTGIIPVITESIKELNNKVENFISTTTTKITTKLVETKKLVVDGVDVLKKLTELSQKVDSQQKKIDNLQKQIDELKKK